MKICPECKDVIMYCKCAEEYFKDQIVTLEINLDIAEAKEISKYFITNVKGKSAIIDNPKGHDGHVGHLLEDLFGLERDNCTKPDFRSIELKKSSPKTTLGDWAPDIGRYSLANNPRDGRKSKKDYFKDYGVINDKGKVHVTGAFYFSREHKNLILKIINNELYLYDVKKNLKVIGWSYDLLKKNVNTKFGNGTVIGKIDNESNTFNDLIFYEGFYVDDFFRFIREDEIIYDPNTNIKRPYSNFRFRKIDLPLKSISYKDILEL